MSRRCIGISLRVSVARVVMFAGSSFGWLPPWSRVGEGGIVWIDDAAEGFGLHGGLLEGVVCEVGCGVGVVCVCFFPFLAAAFVEPHSADVFQESVCAFDAAFVGEVASEALCVDDGLRAFYAHKAPCSAGEVGE